MAEGYRRGLAYGVVAIAALAAGIFFSRLLPEQGSRAVARGSADEGGRAILALSLSDLEGRNQPFAQWRGRVLVVNFWATWCEPCKQEIPELAKVSRSFAEKDLVVVGIALDDPGQVREFTKEFSIPYVNLIGPPSVMEVSRGAGNPRAALPFTVVLDRDGRVVRGHLGQVDQAMVESIVSPLI